MQNMAAAPKQQERASGVIRQEKLAPLDVRLEKLGLVRDWDFALHLPLRYEDETSVTPIGSLAVNTHAQIEGRVADQRFVRTGRGQQLQAVVEDSTGSITIRFLHYFPSIQKQLAVGSTVRLYGEPREGYYGGLEMVHPRIKSGKAAETELPKALTPVYPAGEGIQQRWLRKRIDRALLDLDLTDLVPEAVRTKFGLPGLREALSYIHTPPSGADVIGLQERSAPAWRRLIFDELLAQQITLRESRAVAFQRTAPPLAGDDTELVGCFLAQLPFNLTNAQRRVTDEILADLAANRPMHRLVQGDVGRGAAQSACILLVGEDISPAGWERLKAIRDTTDGFEIARRDLEMRGPGEFLGERQSGTPLLRFADLDRDEALLAAARRTADAWLEKDRDAALRHAARWFKTAGEFLAA